MKMIGHQAIAMDATPKPRHPFLRKNWGQTTVSNYNRPKKGGSILYKVQPAPLGTLFSSMVTLGG